MKDSQKESDEVLVRKSKEGDQAAFAELVNRYESRIYNLAYKMMGSREDAADILQETFLDAYKSLPGFRGEAGLSTWLYRIATNLCLMKLRKKEGKGAVSLDEPLSTEEGQRPREIPDWSTNPAAVVLNAELRQVMDEAIEALPPLYKSVFILRDLEGLSNVEVSKVLGESVPAVKSRLHRARLFLRERLSQYFSGNDLPSGKASYATQDI
ncbi:MAG: sigma-70 family RNA polymerase sigma factor [Nitrospirae bacterium]|nr:sigma-70 family RNA polymerase sigma factor [Nitrospirota bacterium]